MSDNATIAWGMPLLAGLLLAIVVAYPSCTDANARATCVVQCRNEVACVAACSGVGR